MVNSNQINSERSDQIESRSDCNASQMVPTMCSVDEQSNITRPNDTKLETFSTPQDIVAIANENKVEDSNSLAVSEIKVDASKTLQSELNDLKSNNLSLALDRHEPITVYRDPVLANKQIIRHIDSQQHGLMHSSVTSTTTTTASNPSAQQHAQHSQPHAATNVPAFARLPATPQVRTSQASILPPTTASSMAAQYKLSSPALHAPPSHKMSAGQHAHSNAVDQQIYRQIMQGHPIVSAYNQSMPQPIDVLWQQKNFSHISQMPSTWGVFAEPIRAQMLHHESDKQQGIRIERERREDKEKQIKTDKESKEMIEKERLRLELLDKQREQREAVQQHFEESLRLAQQKKSIGWSPISSLPLTKSQSNTRQSPIIPQTQQQIQAIKPNVSFSTRDYDRERLNKDHSMADMKQSHDTERWMAYMHHHQQQQSHQQQSHLSSLEGHKHKTNEIVYYQPTIVNGPSSKPSMTSPMMDTSKHHSMNPQRSAKPEFNIYGYQPARLSFMTPAQLKENNRLNTGISLAPHLPPNVSKVPPAAHSVDKRESPKMIDRALTPSGRNNTPIGRPPSLSPKQKQAKMVVQERMNERMNERMSPLYHRSHTSQASALKSYDYTTTSAPPAHQNSSSRSATPHMNASISQNQLSATYSSLQDQPQNLVKIDSKCKSPYSNNISKSQMEVQPQSPNTNLQSRSSSNVSSGYCISLIQQGLVPNPLYTASSTTQPTTTTSSITSVIAKPQPKPSNASLSQPQSPQLFTRPGPGIISGIPIRNANVRAQLLEEIPINRQNSIQYYGDSQIPTNVMPSQKYSHNIANVKICSSNESSAPISPYADMNRVAKMSPHQHMNATQDRNMSLFHRTPSSPHSPRIASVPIPQSPYGPPPGMIAVSPSVSLSHATPPLAHSGIHSLNVQNSNVKRKSVGETATISLSKKQRIIETPLSQMSVLTQNAESEEHLIEALPNNCNASIKQMISCETSEVIRDASSKMISPSNESNESSNELNISLEENFIYKHQKPISNTSKNVNIDNDQMDDKLSVEDNVSTKTVNTPVSANSTNTANNSMSSFHPKLKKAWLQRHSDEDKIGSVSSVSTLDANNALHSNTPDISKEGESKINDLVVDEEVLKTDKELTNECSEDDETSSASETEQEINSSSKSSKRKPQSRSGVNNRKRINPQIKDKDTKKRKAIQDNSKTEENIKVGKENEDKKKKDKKEAEKDSSKSPPRRGRKPKAVKNDEKDKTSKDSSITFKKKLPKGKSDPSAIAELKKSGSPFLQGGSCVDVAPKLQKCRECRMTPTQRNRKPTIFCRFYDYRKLAYKSNVLSIAGFSQPQDASEEDLKLWLPSEEPPSDLDVETAKFLITHVGDQFCDLVKQEKEAQLLHMGSCNKTITWKRVVQGVREMCDVCETTLFNIHWVCDKCGFVVCIDCYKARKVGSIKEEACPAKDRDGFQWLLCNNRQQHEPQKLEVTQIIAASALSSVGRMLHSIRTKWSIPSNCSCVSLSTKKSNGYTKQVLSVVKIENKQMNGVNENNSKSWKSMNGTVAIIKQEAESLSGYNSESANSPLSFFVDVALTSEKLITKSSVIKEENDIKSKNNTKTEKESENINDVKEDDDNKHSTLRELLMGSTSKCAKDTKSNGSPQSDSTLVSSKKSNANECKLEVETKDDNEVKKEHIELQHFMRRYVPLRKEADPLPIISRTLEETKKLYPNIPHSWFCCGRLLVLHDPKNNNNKCIFQEQWIRGQPVMVKDNHKYLNQNLWHPDSFSRDFGHVKNDLVNCRNGDILAKQPMRKFWDGFENLQNRIRDKNNDYMLLKLKDWPPDEEFSELLPTRYRDLMNSLPLPEYTNRNGVLNLASRLPDCFVIPDLGPKMYSAYGSALYPEKGTTNLHLDISDAVNVMIFVGIPKESNKKDKDCMQEVLNAVDTSGCDELMRKRVREKGVKVGAIWHIYNARDADKIRDLLNKVAIERGETLEPHHDPIHDQSWYLDDLLRDRLLNEYGVEGYAICQCLGDAIFIPAGAPHQVRNLNSCIKVAGDFVSPENVSHCFNLTQEFRQLSDTHTNHEDKLQIKNIIYHAVKDALSCLRNNPQD